MATTPFVRKEYEDDEATKAADTTRNNIYANKPGEFTYDDYTPSESVTNAQNMLNNLQKPGEYQSRWQQSLDEAMNKILNREKFTYDVNGDALYQQYKDQYVNQGRMAMMDTMGQASAMTGGYGSSYASTAGNQAFQGYLQQLNDRVPELYKLALDKYNQEGQELYNQYGLFADREDTDYGRYRDTMSDYYADRDYYTNAYNNERSWDYGLYSDAYNRAYNQHRDSVTDWQNEYNMANNEYWNNRNFGYGKYVDDENFRYSDYRNGIADEQWQKNYQLSADQLAHNIAMGEWQKEQASKASTSGGNGNNGGNSSLTAKEWNDISARCDTYIANNDTTGLKNYLQGLYNRGYITEDEYADFYEQFVTNEQDPPPSAPTAPKVPTFKDTAKEVIYGNNAGIMANNTVGGIKPSYPGAPTLPVPTGTTKKTEEEKKKGGKNSASNTKAMLN